MKKHVFSRGLAFLLCLSMIVGLVPGGLLAATPVVNAVVNDEAPDTLVYQLRNGSFDILGDNNLPKYWKVSGAVEAVADDRYGGSTSLKFTATGATAYVNQTIAVKGGETAKLEAWGKQLTASENYTPSSQIYLGFQNDQGQWVPDGNRGAVVKEVARTSAWEKSTLEVVIPEGATKLIVEVSHNGNVAMGEDGESYSYMVDDVVLTITDNTTAPAPQEQVIYPVNGDFEASDTEIPGWWQLNATTTTNPAKIAADQGLFGNALELKDSDDNFLEFWTNDFAVEGGENYNFSMYIKPMIGTTHSVGVVFFWKDADGNNLLTDPADPNSLILTSINAATSTADWNLIEQTVTAPDDAKKAAIRFYSGGTSTTNHILVDDVTMTKTGVIFTEDFNNVNLGQTFDLTNSQWTHAVKGAQFWRDNGAYDGVGQMCLQTSNDSITSKAVEGITAGNVYLLRYWVKNHPSFQNNDQNGGHAKIIFLDDNNAEVSSVTAVPFANENVWTEKTLIAIAPANATKLKIYFDNVGTNNNVLISLIDYVTVTESTVNSFDSTDNELVGWDVSNGTASIGVNEGVRGTNALKIDDQSNGNATKVVGSKFAVTPGASFALSMQIRKDMSVAATNDAPMISVEFFDATGDTVGSTQISGVTMEKDWTKLVASLTALETATQARVVIETYVDKFTVAYIDDVSICMHPSVVYVYNNDATCTADGTETGYCNICGVEADSRDVAGTEHLQTPIAADEPTYADQSGNSAYYVCSCGKWYSDAACTEEITDKTSVNLTWQQCDDGECEADLTNVSIVYENCTTNGTCDTVCKNCGVPMEDVEVPNSKHTQIYHAEIIPDYETQTGNSAYYACSCDKWYTDAACTDEITDKTSVNTQWVHYQHTLNHIVEKTPDHENQIGNEEYWECATCDKFYSDAAYTTEITNKESVKTYWEHYQHTLTHVPPVVADFENPNGNIEYYTCSCDKWYTDAACTNLIENHDSVNTYWDHYGHTQTPVPENIPDYTNQTGNIEYYICSCDKWYTDAACTVEITNHNDVITYWEHYQHTLTHVPQSTPTFENQTGNEEYWECSCGEWYTDTVYTTEITDHASVVITWQPCNPGPCVPDLDNIDPDTIVGATCTHNGDGDTVCENCGQPMTVEAPNTKHTQTPTVDPESGISYWLCECGKKYVDQECTMELTEDTANVGFGGSFEDADANGNPINWVVDGTATVVTPSFAPTGDKVLQIEQETTVQSARLPVEPGKNYHVKISIKDLSGDETKVVSYTLVIYDANGVEVGRSEKTSNGSGRWGLYSAWLTAPADAASMGVTITTGAGVSCQIDSVILAEVPNAADREEPETEPTEPETEPTEPETEPTEPETEPTEPETEPTEPEVTKPAEYVANGDFEEVTDDGKPAGWDTQIMKGAGITVETDGDNSVVKFVADKSAGLASNMIKSTISVEEGTRLEVKVTSKLLSGDGKAYVALRFYNDEGQNVPERTMFRTYIATTEEWAENAVKCIVPEGATTVVIEIGNGIKQTMTYLVDGVVVLVNGVEPEKPEIEEPTEPEATEPEATEPEATEPETEPTEPETEPTEPEATEPEVAPPATIFSDDFNTNLNQWTNSHSNLMVWIPDPGHDTYEGSRVLLMQDYTTSQGHTITSDDIYVVPGETYTLTYQVMDHWGYIGSSIGSEVKLIFVDANGIVLDTVTKPAASEEGANVAEWTQKTVEAVAPANAAILRIEFNTSVEKTNVIYLVDALVVRGVAGTLPEGLNLVINGEFEAGTANWSAPADALTIVTNDKYSGAQSAQYTKEANVGAYVKQIVSVEAGKTYKLSAMVKRISGTDSGYIGVYEIGDANARVTVATVDNEWTYYCVEVTIPEGYTQAQIEFGADRSRAVTYLIDQIVFVEVENA